MADSDGALLDLVCGPASPLPESYQRYRLVAHLGSGGQAEVYRGVRLCGGVASAPVTVKVFRIDPKRPLVDELRSWDKGDAALMDLNNRGVPSICRRADGFYGPPPHKPGQPPQPEDAVPYQIYDYLHGVNLREYARAARKQAPGTPLSGIATLRTLATILRALHLPTDPDATPVLHMDVKPSNVMVLATGGVRLIDFTGARYWKKEEITQIAYTPESGGPEALDGDVGTAYDVHGFGAVAYFMVTGSLPRGREAPPPGKHPVLAGRSALRDHLLTALADQPGDRPTTTELVTWADQLGALVRQAKPPTTGVDWSEPEAASTAPAGRVVGRASVVRGTETDYFRRVEALEREVVQLRDKVLPGSIPTPGAPGRLVSTAAYAGRPLDNGAAPNDRGPVAPAVGSVSGGTSPESPSDPVPPAGANGAGGPGGDQPGADAAGSEGAGGNVVAVGARIGPAGGGAAGTPMVGRAAVGPRRAPVLDETGTPIATRVRVREPAGALKVGANFTWFSAIFAFVCWSVWAVFNRTQSLILPLLAFALALLVAAGLFTLLRLVGRLVMVRWLNRPRRTARVAHFLTGAFLIAVGVSYIGSTSWIMQIVHWFS